jgi:hypothetical protein
MHVACITIVVIRGRRACPEQARGPAVRVQHSRPDFLRLNRSLQLSDRGQARRQRRWLPKRSGSRRKFRR